jgi:hypothetical protein
MVSVCRTLNEGGHSNVSVRQGRAVIACDFCLQSAR